MNGYLKALESLISTYKDGRSPQDLLTPDQAECLTLIETTPPELVEGTLPCQGEDCDGAASEQLKARVEEECKEAEAWVRNALGLEKSGFE